MLKDISEPFKLHSIALDSFFDVQWSQWFTNFILICCGVFLVQTCFIQVCCGALLFGCSHIYCSVFSGGRMF